MKIGVFGGTFNPPHIGHLILADEASTQLGLDLILWVPVSKPPHKPDEEITDIHQRIDLLRSAIKNNSRFQLSNIDIDRPPPHFALETMKCLRQSHLMDDLVYLMGSDSLLNLHKWHKPIEFVESCTALGIMRRPGAKIDLEVVEKRLPGISQKLRFIETPLIDISASQIRLRIKNGLAYQYYLPERVFKIVEVRNLYR